jgi:hypothetical protein
MPTIEITDDHRDRIEALREELTTAHAGPYASVDTEDALAYLLDLAAAVDDPERRADSDRLGADETEAEGTATADGVPDGATTDGVTAADDRGGPPFDRDRARERLESRPRRHSDPEDAAEMDLDDIAAAFDVTGRSDMTKAETIEAILDAAEALATDPFSWVDVDLGDDADRETSAADGTEADAAAETKSDTADGTEAGSDDAGASRVDAMMSLLDTHADKWREGDGDARYEVDLPGGDVETARTKDDVRALLFKNY